MAGLFVSGKAPKFFRQPKVARVSAPSVRDGSLFTYGEFKSHMENLEIDLSDFIMGLSGLFREVQESGNNFERFFELVTCTPTFMRLTPKQAIVKLKEEAEQT